MERELKNYNVLCLNYFLVITYKTIVVENINKIQYRSFRHI
jgi:hypothetical protein